MRAFSLFGWSILLCLGVPAQAGPVVVPDRAVLILDELGHYEVGYQLRGQPETRLPMGWTGGLESPTGAACQPAGNQSGKEAWLLHCPWKGKTGVTFQEFTVALPPVPQIILRGATALRADAAGKSDGATYRVFVNGEKRFEANRKDGDWQAFEIDLTPLAGKTVTLRFETDPGPRDDASFDFSLWGERRLEMPGFVPLVAFQQAPPPLDLRRLSSEQNGSVAPLSGFPGKTTVHGLQYHATLRYEGADGTLEYHWNHDGFFIHMNADGSGERDLTPDTNDSLLGSVDLVARMAGVAFDEAELSQMSARAGRVFLGTQAHLEWTADATLTSPGDLTTEPTTDGGQQAILKRTYSVGGQTATVTIAAFMQGKSLVFDVTCDRPVVRVFDGGGWGPVMRRRVINLPYYSEPILYLEKENLFAGAFLDWTNSQASSHAGLRAVYDPRTDGTRNLLHERVIYTAASHLDEILPNLPNAPSPFRADLAGRVMLDIWGGRFADIQARLHALAEAGFGPGAAIIHDWQFGGYDNKLPRHIPANPDLGGDPAMAALVEEGQRDGFRMALHENYADDYPDSPDFAESDLARAPDGSRVLAWFQPDTKIQSFGIRPARIVPLAQTQGPEILRRYGANASYLDVHSAVPPWFHVDFAAGQLLAGEFGAVWDAHRALWAYERDLHHGPVFGEGSGYWWNGALDGVEAQFGQGWPGPGTGAPLLVDFDLLKMHPLQLNHGMGYYERWWARGPDARRGLLSLLDQYRMQEAAYGHEGFLGGEAWHDPGYAWLESHLLPPLTMRSALARPVAIDYRVGGRWLDSTAAAKAGADWSQVRVRYDNGLTVWANGGDQPLAVDDATTLPPNGWLARGAGLTAGTTLRQGIVTDAAETADSVFVNARPAADWEERGVSRIRPSVAQFTPTAPRAFRASYQWTAGQSVPEDLLCFVHFVPVQAEPGAEKISFQQDHALATPTSRWTPGQTLADGPWDITVPGDAAPGDYLWLTGLYKAGGGRLTLQGISDSQNRLVLGTLHVAADGAVAFTPAPTEPRDTAPVNREGRVVDFGSIRTDGSVCVRREGADWVLRPFPSGRAFTVELAAARFGHAGSAPVTEGWWRLPLTGERVYRWPAAR